jgi:tRNA dimethylallyltransferase
LIDIRNPGERYSLFEYQRDFLAAYTDIRNRRGIPVLCGGTGLYAESVLKGYPLEEVPEDEEFRVYCEGKTDEELAGMLREYGPLHNITDIMERPRLVRALEIARHKKPGSPDMGFPRLNSRVFGIAWEREERRNRITKRLMERLAGGMVDEVRELLKTVTPQDLIYYGLEYKYITLYCTGKISYDSMVSQLNIAIHQFSKRQLSWFRRMEKQGIGITWIPGEMEMARKMEVILERLK